MTSGRSLVGNYTAPADLVAELVDPDAPDEIQSRQATKSLYSKQSEYHKRHYERLNSDQTEKEQQQKDNQKECNQKENDQNDNDDDVTPVASPAATPPASPRPDQGVASPPRKKSRWDVPKTSRWDQVGDSDTSPLSDADLDRILPPGYKILTPPPGYAVKTEGDDSEDKPDGYIMLEDTSKKPRELSQVPADIPGVGDLQFFKESDMKYFGKLMDEDHEDESMDQLKEKRILRLLLRIKNGVPAVRKAAMRQIAEEARQLGAAALFNQLLPLLMERSLEEQERHLLVKVIDRVLHRLGELVRPFTHRILVVVQPLLIDEEYFARQEGREIVSNLSKAAGLAHMITTMRPDIDSADEFVRNTTARAFAIVASALGVPQLLPFVRAVCRSQKSWQARHTGVKIVQQIALLMGVGVLPHLNELVDCIGPNLQDDQLQTRTMTAQALAALAEAAAPYGFESFEPVVEPLWSGIRRHRGRGLAAFLKCIGFIIPLMEPEHANYYTREVMIILLREFESPDEDMKRVVLKVVQQCAATDGVTAQYLRENVVATFFRAFWTRRLARDRRLYRLVVETTTELGKKIGSTVLVERLVPVVKDANEPFRRMGVDAIDKILTKFGASNVTGRTEELVVDAVLTAFQSQQESQDIVYLKGLAAVVNSLGERATEYIPQVVSTILFRLSNQSAEVRQQAADLISKIAVTLKLCHQDTLMGKMGQILYEQLGEEYPEVLGSVLSALSAIVAVVGLTSMQPPIRDLLPRLTPILRNRHEKVQESAIQLVGTIADRGPEFVSAREWMRICFELLDMLKARRKSIRRAANQTFGYIAKAIGPQDVLATLLNNLKVQERQLRVCTAVAIGIVAETCGPFTVLPALMNEYRAPDLNVQNGVLKAMTFLFEYIGDMTRDYVYAVTPLVEDALIDRDQVHRQTAATVVQHLALGCMGYGYEDVMVHLLNLIMPNLFETSPHVIDRVLQAVEAIRNAVGPGVVLNYTWAGLFQAARKVREPYWRVYNAAYVQSADAMVPYYPSVQELPRDELDVVV